MERKSPSINLLKNNENILDRFVDWALSIGRVVVIITELIALGAFLYRFSLDRQLIDIHSRIKQEQTVVSYLKNNEDTYRNLQNRIAMSSNLSKIGKDKVNILKDVLGFVPQGVTLNNVTVQEDKVRIDASAGSIAPISDLVKALKGYPKVSSVIIDKIENRSSSASIDVSIAALLKLL